MIGLADIYIWARDNGWWLVALIPVVVVIIIVRSLSPR